MEGVERSLDEGELAAIAVAEHVGRDAVPAIIPVAAIDLDRRGERFAAGQPLDDIGVARRGQVAGREVGRDEQVIGIFPGDAVLAARQVEAAGDEGGGVEIELAHLDRILAAVGQRDQAALLERPKALCALEHPALALGLTQRVDVEHRGPGRAGVAVVGQRRLAPDAAQMLGILPEIIDRAMDEARRGDAVPGPGDGQRLVVEGRIMRIGLEQRGAGRIVRIDPLHRARRRDVLEPQIRIFGRRLGNGGEGQGDSGEQGEGKQAHGGDPHKILVA